MKKLQPIALIAIFIFFFFSGIALMSYLQAAFRGTTLILGVDVYPRWIGAQAALLGESPYSLETRQSIWDAIYGSRDLPNGNLFGFYYPPSIVTLLVPFIALGLSVKQAAIAGCAFLWALWGTFLLFWIIEAQEKQKIVVALFLLSGLFFRPAFSNYILGQSALFCVMMIVAAWMCICHEWNIAAGICLALALIKPSNTILPVMLLLALNYRSKNILFSFLITNLVLFVPPTLLLGWWVPDFLADISKYSFENQPAWTIQNIWTIPGIVNLILSVALMVWGYRRADTLLLVASALAFNSLFVPHTADYDLIMFILLVLWIHKQRPLIPGGAIGRILLLLILLWLPWISLSPFAGRVEDWYVAIWKIYPTILLLTSILLIARQMKETQPNMIGQP